MDIMKTCNFLFLTSVLVAAGLVASGCTNFGPKAIQASRTDYNIALQITDDEQLLLNLVRLKYRDRLFFLQASAVTTQFLFRPSAEASALVGSDINDEFGLKGGWTYEEKPTVTYTPLQGQDFVQQVLSPVTLDTVMLLANSGWSSERILRVCVQRLNRVENAATAAGPTPPRAPEFERFVRATKLLRTLALRDAFRVGYRSKEGKSIAILHFNREALDSPEYQELASLLDLTPGLADFNLRTGIKPGDGNSIVMQTRSFSGIMYFLSQSVEIPTADAAAGRVTLTRDASGNPFDWSRVTQDIMQIRSSDTRPTNAAIAVRYRGNWFFIDDSDLHSKSTFTLLGQLFALQSGKVEGAKPVLTLPVGN